MKILILTTSGFAPTHTDKLLSQIEYLNSFSDIYAVVEKDCELADIEHLIMTQNFDCVYPSTVFEFSEDKKSILSFNKVLFQILEYHKQAYIGSEIFVHMLLNDKALTNLRSGMSLPSLLLTKVFWYKRNADALKYIDKAPFPVIVKPNTLAASLGISKKSIAYTRDNLIEIIERQFNTFSNLNEVLLEHYLEDAQEFTVSVTGNGRKRLCSATAMIPKKEKYEIYSYTNKNLKEQDRTLKYSSDIPLSVKRILKERAVYLSELLCTRDYSRFDFLMDTNNNIYLIDANSLPSLGTNYLMEYINKQLVSPEQIFSLILLVFCKRMGIPYPKCKNNIPDKILELIF
ncbi:MAG: hypothetical protein HDR06_03475 [Lachnospiraceae bacterium]|nr:hypothetical protein [Lachnospiraceae bacterium]